MSNRITWLAVALALLLGGIAWYRMHNRKELSREVTVGVPAASTTAPNEATAAGGGPGNDANAPHETERVVAPVPATDMKKAAPVVPEATGPVHAGETWKYSANVSKLNAVANLLLKVVEKRNVAGKSTWHLQAFAHTENPLRMVFALDDQFDSYSDANSLVSVQYEMHLSEKGEKVDVVQRLTSAGNVAAPPDAMVAHVLPGTRDPLGMMQYLRTVDWTKTPEVHSSVYDGHKLYEVYARLVSRGESVTVPAGNFKVNKIELRVLDNGAEMKDAHFVLYLTETEDREPVLLEAVMPFATARVELTQ
jgi:hypothetical protein